MATIPTNGYAEVMAGSNNYSGSNSYDGSCPRTAIPPVIGDDLCNKTYVDTAAGGGLIGSLTDKGSLITADGTQAVIFDQNPYQSALTTTTVYDWNSLAVAQSRNFTTTAPTSLPLGASITITYSGTDSITGTVTAVVGTTVTLTITALASATYTPAVLLNTSAATTYASGSLINPLPYITADTTPNPPEIQANSIITQGELFFYSSTGTQTVTVTIGGTSIQRAVSTAGLMPIQPATAPPPPAVPTALFWNGANGGCFVGDTQEVGINVSYSAGLQPTWGFLPSAPDFQAYFIGSLTGYTLSYNTGSITITGNIALLADPVSSTGLKWGVVSGGGGGGTVNSVIGGTNVIISGTATAPVVNLRDPLTAQLNCGTQSIIDRNGSSGSSGQVLTAGTGSQVLWGANGVSSVTATPFANITINNTVPSAPTIGVSNPCNATLALGVQNLTALNGFDASTINANGIDTTYLQAGVAGANADLNTNLGNSQLFMSSSDLAGGSSHLLQMVCPLSIGNVDILHTTVGATKRNMDIATEGSLGISAGITTVPTPAGSNTGITINSGGLAGNTLPTTFKNSNAGNIANPIMKLENTNATGSVALECYKNKPTASVNGDVLFTQSVFGKDSGNAKQEYTRINHSVRDTTAGVEDGSIEFGCFVNGAINTFLQINGNENEVNCLRVLDMAGNNIRTNTGNITLDATTSTGNGIINLNPKTGTGYVAINNASASNLRLDGTINNLTAPTKNTIDMAVNPSATVPINGFTINRDLVKLDFQDGITNDVSVIYLANDPSPLDNRFEASYLTASTGDLALSTITTTPTQHRLQLFNAAQAKGTNIYPSKAEFGNSSSLITIDSGFVPTGVQISGSGTSGSGGSNGNFNIQTSATTQEFYLQSTDLPTAQTKTLQLDNNTTGDGIISYTNNTGDGAELQITSNTDISIGTIGGSGNSVFIDALNEATVSSQNQLSLKVATANQPITFQVANTGGFLNFVGTDLQSNSSGGSSGQHLCITLNGTQYKIDLKNP